MFIDHIYQILIKIYCEARNGCLGSTINDVNGSIFAALGVTTITNVQGYLIGLGYKVINESTVVNTTYVYCDGTLSCAESTFIGIKQFEAYGENCMIWKYSIYYH